MDDGDNYGASESRSEARKIDRIPVGVEYAFNPGIVAKATWFRNDLEDMIKSSVRRVAGRMHMYYENVDEAMTQGLS